MLPMDKLPKSPNSQLPNEPGETRYGFHPLHSTKRFGSWELGFVGVEDVFSV